jgi:hypothetical protein
MQINQKGHHLLDILIESSFFDGHMAPEKVPFRERKALQPRDCSSELLPTFVISFGPAL